MTKTIILACVGGLTTSMLNALTKPSTRINWTTLSIQLGLPGLTTSRILMSYSLAHS